MTREEAIEILYYQRFVVDFQTGKALEMAISALRQQEHNEPLTLDELRKMDGEPMTNAQRIRAMSDEELVNVVPCPLGFSMFRCPIERQCGPCKRDWLQQPAEESK